MDYFVIYYNPSDYPGHYVVRQFDATAFDAVSHQAQIFTSLTEARAAIPPGRIFFPRHEDDDSVIVETWI